MMELIFAATLLYLHAFMTQLFVTLFFLAVFVKVCKHKTNFRFNPVASESSTSTWKNWERPCVLGDFGL